MQEAREQERWSDYDSSSAEEETERCPPPEEENVVRSLREQAMNRRKRRAEGGAGEQTAQEGRKRRRRVYNIQEQRDPPPPMNEDDEQPALEDETRQEQEEQHNQPMAEQGTALINLFEQEYAQYNNHMRDLTWTAENNPQEDKETRDAHFKPALLPLEREIELALLHQGENQTAADSWQTCVLCNSQKMSGVGLVRDNFNMMMRALMDEIGHVIPQVLFRELHQFFIKKVIVQMREIRRIQRTAAKEKSNTEERGTFGEETTSVAHAGEIDENYEAQADEAVRDEFARQCTPYRFYRHFTTHSIDPTLATVMSLWRQNEIIRIIETECLLQRHDLTGRFTFRPDLVLGYSRMMNVRKQTYELDPSKMIGFTTQRQLNPAKSNPLISQHRPQFNPNSALNRQVFPVHESPLMF